MQDIMKFGTVIMTPTLEQTQFGKGAVTKLRHKLRAHKGQYFIGVCLGIVGEELLRGPTLMKELDRRMEALGWVRDKTKAKPRTKKKAKKR